MFWHTLRSGFMLLLIVVLVAAEKPQPANEQEQFLALAGTLQFNFVEWELDTLWQKGTADLAAGHIFLPTDTRQALVLEYVERLAHAQQLAAELERIYTDPAQSDPAATAAPTTAELAAERERLLAIQPMVEAIVEEQVATVLLEEGFGHLGHTWPPVRMHITPLPTLLVISPREEIRTLYSVPLQAGLLAPEREELETAVRDQFSRAGYVTNIGGLGIYPAMIIETASLPFLLEVTAHEWTHHWLNLYPVGLNYNSSAAMRTINETAASIVGKEIVQEVLRRYYPELVPPPAPPPAPPQAPPADAPPTPPPFDYRAAMAETRITADALLAAGQTVRAEFYMEARRRLFVEQGYQMRVLNQAYFAFHGSYADVGGATGSDPIGPLVRTVRLRSPDLRHFLDALTFVTSAEDLETAANAAP